MDSVNLLPANTLGRGFIPAKYLPKGKDEHYLRDAQTLWKDRKWRHLRADEVAKLARNHNTASNWSNVRVIDGFDPGCIKNTEFYGLVRIGSVRDAVLGHHDLQLPVGITNSRIIACDIGDDAAIHNVRYLAHVIIGNRCMLANIDEMHTTDHAKFGVGIVKDGEPEKVRIWLELINETGSRAVLPFDGIVPADAYLWAKYRDDSGLQKRLRDMTQASFDSRRGYYSTVGDQCVIKNSRILKDVAIGSHCYIKGANKLKNLTIHSSPEEPTQVGEGVELVNGIIGFGCHIFYGCKAVRFVLGNNANLKYGARLINSFLGDNSTISCCEVLNNLIFPAHEQHHNNSFLIASLVMGQSNVAAGATIGSNHNSRANDGEIQAGRGFWPGLCTSVKHSCRFASFVLLSKADYPAELDIPLPFSLINNNASRDRLEVMPAFWWMYNMYALARNAWKFRNRDKRKNKAQHIEFDALAPDTVEEILHARRLLEIWTAKAARRENRESHPAPSETALIREGRKLLSGDDPKVDSLEVLGDAVEKSSRPVLIIKTRAAYRAYGDMLHYYAVKNLVDYLRENPKTNMASMARVLGGSRASKWTNFGGQIVPEADADRLRSDIRSGKLKTWEHVHERYRQLWERYPMDKRKHAFAVLCDLLKTQRPSAKEWAAALQKAAEIQEDVCERVYASRKKDFDNTFRQVTFRNREEMIAVTGTVEDNAFVKQVREETLAFKKTVAELKKRG